MRASFARIHRRIECAAWLEPLAHESLAAAECRRSPWISRRRSRATARIWRLTEDFEIAFAAQNSGWQL